MAPDTTNGRQACTTVEPQHFDLKEKMKSQNEVEKIETNIQNHISDTNQIQNDKCNVQTEDKALLSVKKPISNNIEEDLNNDSNVRHRQIENKEVDEQKEMEVSKEEELNDTKVAEEPFKSEIRWPDFIVQIFLHAGCLYGLFLVFAAAKFYTSLFAFATIYTSGFGITAGAHRLWSHRAYKAKWPLRLLLVFLFTITGQRDVYTWALDHRVHHKYTETDSDPHDARRGFFFSHVGWLFLTPHPEVVARRKAVDMSDLEADPIVMWQKRLYVPLFALLNIIIPVLVPVWLWQETIWNSFWVNFNCRFTITLNIAFFVNSVAHMWGQRPYDKNISPVENMAVAIAALGEGWHNYHHVFPWDYKTGELGDYSLNLTTGFIDFFAKLGWAYDRKSVSSKMIARRAIKNGDGSFIIDHHHMESASVWGYGDKDIPHDDMIELDNMKDKKD